MANPPTPRTPNFVPGVGQLVTYRVDFESHILGTDFRQNATTVDMSPVITINGSNPTTVQAAIEALTGAIGGGGVSQATSGTSVSNLGIVTLGGDFAGIGTTALSPKVSGIQGRPISSASPTSGQALVWNGSAWVPTTVGGGGGFTAGADLTGNSTNQYIQSLSGANGGGGAVTLAPTAFISASANTTIIKINGNTAVASDAIGDVAISSVQEMDLFFGTIIGFKHGTTSSHTDILNLSESSGDFIIMGDSVANASTQGLIRLGGSQQTIISARESGTNYPILSIDGSQNTVIDGGAGANVIIHMASENVVEIGPQGLAVGINVAPSFNSLVGGMFLQNANNLPSGGGPSNGATLYATSGNLWIQQSNGATFQIQPPGGFTAGGDLIGTSSSQTVVGIQSRPVSASAPSVGQVLEWNGSTWTPVTIGGGSVIWANDLLGSTSSNQWVAGLSGSGGSGGAVTLLSTAYVSGGSNQKYIANGSALIFGTDGTGSTGSTVVNSATGNQVKLQINGTSSFFIDNNLVTTDTPTHKFSTGGGGVSPYAFLRWAGGVIGQLYLGVGVSGAGTDYILQSDVSNAIINAPMSSGNIQFNAGSIAHPMMTMRPWQGSVNGQSQALYSVPATVRSTNASPVVAYTFAVPTNTVAAFDVTATAKLTGSMSTGGLSPSNCGVIRTAAAFANISGTISQCGSTIQLYNEGVGGGAITFNVSGTNVQILVGTGNVLDTTEDWQLNININNN